MTPNKVVTITTDRIRQAWLDWRHADHGGEIAKHPVKSSLGFWKVDGASSFIGDDPNLVDKWLTEGFYGNKENPDLVLPNAAAEVDIPFMDFVEEDGDLIVEAAIAGDDLPYTKWENLKAHRGLDIEARFDFNGGTPGSVVAEYASWLLSLVDMGERSGVSPSLTIYMDTTGNGYGDAHVRIPLVKAGELADHVAWRAYLSTAGFRTLGFTALVIAGTDLKRKCSSLGGAIGGYEWAVKMDHDRDTLVIECDCNARKFPAEKMTEHVRREAGDF